MPKEKVIIELGGIGLFTLDDYNPYVKQVKEFIENKDIKYQDSIIKDIRDNIICLIENNEFENLLGVDLQNELLRYIPEKVIKKLRVKMI